MLNAITFHRIWAGLPNSRIS